MKKKYVFLMGSTLARNISGTSNVAYYAMLDKKNEIIRSSLEISDAEKKLKEIGQKNGMRGSQARSLAYVLILSHYFLNGLKSLKSLLIAKEFDNVNISELKPILNEFFVEKNIDNASHKVANEYKQLPRSVLDKICDICEIERHLRNYFDS